MSTLGENNNAGNNYSQILILDVAKNQWIVQKRVANSLNGTGAGGRRRIKSYVFGPKARIGGDLQLYFSNAQELYRAAAQNSDGTMEWQKIAATGSSGVQPGDDQFKNILHNDIWDFHVGASGADLWIACDGGVYQNSPAVKGWVTRNYGLHTQYLNNVSAADSPDLHVAYPTHDNSAWFRTTPGTFDHEDQLGDASWVAGDTGANDAALLSRQSGPCGIPSRCNELTGFGSNLPSGAPLQGFVMTNDASFNGPGFFSFIQSLPTELAQGSNLDAVMLAKLPLQYTNANGNLANVPGHLGNPAADGTESLVLLRNKQFVNNPDINASKGAGWEIAANNMPAGSFKFWVTGGHSSPLFLVLANQGGALRLFRSLGGPPFQQLSQWLELNVQGNVLQPQPYPASQVLDGALLGPVFVNPYDFYEIYVLTGTGVRYSTTGGFSFSTDQDLTDLITAGGQYPLVGNFTGNNGPNIDLTAGYATPFGNQSHGSLSAMAFSRKRPGEVVAASPFTGVFFRQGSTAKWVDLSKSLPTPLAPITGLAINDYTIYVALKGRGLLAIRQFRRHRIPAEWRPRRIPPTEWQPTRPPIS
jgi:hypothetical protein